mgnify:CR=1 FL=1
MNIIKNIRPPAVAGMFYPGNTSELNMHIRAYLGSDTYTGTRTPKVLIVPHAGTVYSGAIAAAAYRTLIPFKNTIKKVVLLGPAHQVHVNGLALPTMDQFQTPLANVNLDKPVIMKLVADFSQVCYSDRAHQEEHSLEVQLPFLQSVLSDFSLIPFVVGDASDIEVADVIESLWGGPESLIIISTDLSHFHNYEDARNLDSQTADQIEAFNGDALADQSACGRIPLRGLLRVARQKQMTIERFDLRNSGDTAGRKDQVVGYGSWGLFE